MATNRDLRALGRTIAEMEDAALEARERPPASERLTAINSRRARRAGVDRRLRRWSPIAFGAAAAAAVLALWFRAEPLTFAVGDPALPGELGVWVAAPLHDATPVAFSDGTRVSVSAGARARVVSVNAHGARVVIERGTVKADVVPRSGNDWSVIGGPFEIHVTGTSFDASWDPEREALHIAMYEGHVVVRANCIEGVRALSKGESATLSCLKEPAAAEPVIASSATSPKPPASALASANAPSPKDAPEKVGAPEHATDAAMDGSWRELSRAGDYKGALSLAETEGFGSLCETLSMSELLELATAARLAGKTGRATEAYSALRKRFAGTDAAATAAFHLGQMAFDGAHAYSEARRFFLAYLAERPGGALGAEALGRTMEAEQRLGELASARATAERYLSRYPTGAHASLAKSLLAP